MNQILWRERLDPKQDKFKVEIEDVVLCFACKNGLEIPGG